ncbi:hypothetical protein GWK08_13500 [Leptobacterium flavescens]|uniref:50S ribosomal protein L27 n=1 Tax=Leptobacterium flavescens TaxID=472055 RepID=A0A6P0UUH5_9FLAO|nr:hypothetical protein [Leptobacterium flavescens]NER14463.1 hypothetical protein [Leptobacterium flavescens]
MYETVRVLHSYWAYLALLILLFASINAVLGFSGNRDFKNKDLRISLFGLIFSHIQLLIGLVLYFVSARFAMWSEIGMGGIMKDSVSRLYLVEHPIVNILAIVLITIGWSKHKKQETSKKKFGKIGLFYTLGLILILSRIPWDVWFS